MHEAQGRTVATIQNFLSPMCASPCVVRFVRHGAGAMNSCR